MKTNIPRILLIDDEPDILELLSMTLARMGLKSDQTADVATARRMLKSHTYDLCLTDLRLPDGSGIEIVKLIQQSPSNTPVAVISAHGNMETAIEALKAGAFDFISKPIELGQLRDLVENALSLDKTREKAGKESGQIHGISPEIGQIRRQIQKLARNMAPVHICGESGTGKELVAKLIHSSGPHADKPFIAVNCSAIPSELMESEFFGHVKGSFTGAYANKPGLFKAAEGGTLFLDEIADLPLAMQAKLLRAIQERAVRPVGAHEEIPVNCRILSATHKNLRKQVKKGMFREDLFYRINVIELLVPPLRKHREDIPALVEQILIKISARNHLTDIPKLNDAALKMLIDYAFPGNVRELENILERAIALYENEIQVNDLALQIEETSDAPPHNRRSNESLDDYLERVERALIKAALDQSDRNKTRAAEHLGISFRSLRYKLKKLYIS